MRRTTFMQRLFSPLSMIWLGAIILCASITLYLDERYSVHIPYGAESVKEAGVFVLDDQHGMGCHFNMFTPMMECMPDELWMTRDLEREADFLKQLNKDIQEQIDERYEELENEIWELLHKQGKIWKA